MRSQQDRGDPRPRHAFRSDQSSPSPQKVFQSPRQRSKLSAKVHPLSLWIIKFEWRPQPSLPPNTHICANEPRLFKKQVMAEREGFEPSRRLPAYTRSRRAPSTTRPPLHCALRAGRHYNEPQSCCKTLWRFMTRILPRLYKRREWRVVKRRRRSPHTPSCLRRRTAYLMSGFSAWLITAIFAQS